MRDILIVIIFFILMIPIIVVIGGLYNYFSIYTNVIYKNRPYILDGVSHEPINLPKDRVRGISDTLARQLKDIAVRTRDVFEKHSIGFWASDGTLIGAVRHRGFIPWDDDMDFRTDIGNIDKILSPEVSEDLRKVGLRLTYSLMSGEAVSSIRVQYIGQRTLRPPFLDILFEVPTEDGKLVRCVDVGDMTKLGVPHRCNETLPKETWERSAVYPLRRYEFEDIWLPGPNDADTVLRTQYGDYQKIVLPKIDHAPISWLLPSVSVRDSVPMNSMKTIMHVYNILRTSY